MKNLAKYSVDRAITVFMAVIIVAIFGVVSFTRLTTDLFPSMNIPYAIVVTTYIGASPDEVEEIVFGNHQILTQYDQRRSLIA